MFTKLILIICLFCASSYAVEQKQANIPDTFEIYFDLPSLDLLHNNIYLKYHASKYFSKKKKKTKYHESIKYLSKDNNLYTFNVKHYNSVKHIEEKHPLLSLIKRKDRALFKDILKKDGILYPMKLKYVLEANYNTKEESSYQKLFKEKFGHSTLAKLNFEYPYLIKLFYAILFSIIGLIIIFFQLRKRTRDSSF